MSNRKYESGYEKLKKRRRIEKLVESQKGALDKFVTSSKKSTDLNENLMAEQSNPTELIDNIEQNEEHEKNTGENKKNVETIISDSIYDPGNWDNIDNKIRD